MNTQRFEYFLSQLTDVFRRITGQSAPFDRLNQLEECRLYCPVTRAPQRPVKSQFKYPYKDM